MTHSLNMLAIPFALAATVVGLPRTARADAPGVAVVELFTSEGCSSCPPADAALADLIRDSHGQRVYALAFHVDYWNYIGWTDAYSTPAFTERQNVYARLMKLSSIYTPQAIVNGTQEFVGSRRDTLKQSVAAALATPAQGTLAATVGKVTNGKTPVDVVATGLPAGTIVNVAVIESGISVAVRAGENGGRTLTHENVVRAYASVPLGQDGKINASLAVPVNAKQTSVVVYAQRPADMGVVAATEVDPPP